MKPPVSESLVYCLRVTLAYAEKLTTDIPAGDFAHLPHPGMNHAAFCIGHLSLYPNELLRLIVKESLVLDKGPAMDVFRPATPCVEQDGRYPPKHEIIEYYLERHRVLCDVIAGVDDQLARPYTPPDPRMMSPLFPTIGVALIFYLNNHHMLHLGQISAWRRAMGLPALKWGEPENP